ncbi:MAG TPA: hypothetical protein VK563_22310 [Puia sp.]|nr:hypothetical protein [Puia sp.]
MKRLLFVASVCLGLFAFTVNHTYLSSGNHHFTASGNDRALMSDTTKKPRDSSKPNPDTPKLASIIALQGR